MAMIDTGKNIADAQSRVLECAKKKRRNQPIIVDEHYEGDWGAFAKVLADLLRMYR